MIEIFLARAFCPFRCCSSPSHFPVIGGSGVSPGQQLRGILAGSPLHSEPASALEEEQTLISASVPGGHRICVAWAYRSPERA